MCLRIHIVKKGDTLWKIAKEYGVDFEQLKRMNSHLANPDIIYPGMEIYLPDKEGSTPSVQSGGGQGTSNQSSKEMLTRPIDEFILPKEALSPKEQLTKPIEEKKPTQEKPITKEKKTEPIKEMKPPKEVEKKTKPIELKPTITPQFHFDFAPQIHHQTQSRKPQPMPQPMPQPQPILIEMPQQQPQPQPIFIEMPKHEQQPIHIEMPQMQHPVEHVKEYIPIQQPHFVYIPYICYVPCPEPMPQMPLCDCHQKEQHTPCPCEHMQNLVPYMQPEMMPQMPMQLMPTMDYLSDSSDYVMPQIDLKKAEEGLPDWLERESSSTPNIKLRNESSSLKKKSKHPSKNHPYMNPSPYKPWDC